MYISRGVFKYYGSWDILVVAWSIGRGLLDIAEATTANLLVLHVSLSLIFVWGLLETRNHHMFVSWFDNPKLLFFRSLMSRNRTCMFCDHHHTADAGLTFYMRIFIT